MEQFNLEKYLKNPSRKVVTRGGQNVRIICTNRRDLNFPIIALIENKSGLGETTVYYTRDGKFYINGSTDFDLFFAPEKHIGWINIFKWTSTEPYLGESRIYSSKELAESTGRNYRDYLSTIKIEWEE